MFILIMLNLLCSLVFAENTANLPSESLLNIFSSSKDKKKKDTALPNTEWADTDEGKAFYKSYKEKKEKELKEQQKLKGMSFYEKQRYLRKKQKIKNNKYNEKREVHQSSDF